jgi:hypothetical protein
MAGVGWPHLEHEIGSVTALSAFLGRSKAKTGLIWFCWFKLGAD